MKLPEAIALMLEGKVMVDSDGIIYRAIRDNMHDMYALRGFTDGREFGAFWLSPSGWREATPEELKEIGL